MIEQLQLHLTEDLLKPRYRGSEVPCYGHCYVATEALWYLLRGCEGGWRPKRGQDSTGIVHWWLENDKGEILDATAVQYTSQGVEPPYDNGRFGGFLTKEPSKRAKELIRRLSLDPYWDVSMLNLSTEETCSH